MWTKYLSIDRERVAQNVQNGTDEAVILIERPGFAPVWARRAEWDGPSALIYDPNHQEVGDLYAKAWVQTQSPVAIITPEGDARELLP